MNSTTSSGKSLAFGQYQKNVPSHESFYQLSFYKDEITPHDWSVFLEKLSSFAWTVTLLVQVQGGRIRYFIKDIPLLENGNSLFHPMRVIAVPSPVFRVGKGIGLRPIYHTSIFSFNSQEQVKRNRSVDLLVLTLSIKQPFNPSVGCGTIIYSDGKKESIVVHDPLRFLSFGVQNTVEKSVDKVTVELKNSDLNQHSDAPQGILFQNGTGRFGVNDFDFSKHSLIVGQSGSGKSKFLELFIRGLAASGLLKDYSVIFIDPHGEVQKHAHDVIKRHIDFRTEALQLFSNAGEPSMSTELTLSLFSSFIDFEKNPYVLRVLKHALYLLFSTQRMSLSNLSLLLTDTLARKNFIRGSENEVLKRFFEIEYLELSTQRYDVAVLPIINLINEYTLLSAGIQDAKQYALPDLLLSNSAIFATVNPAFLGKNMTKFVGGAILQQVFTLSQAGIFKKKVLLIVDEASLVQNPALAHILSESRKFGLTLILSQQYLGQLSQDLTNSIKANMVNLFFFKINRDDAKVAKEMMNLELNPIFETGKSFAEIEEKKMEILTESHPRECVVRIMQNGSFAKPIKVRTIDAPMVI